MPLTSSLHRSFATPSLISSWGSGTIDYGDSFVTRWNTANTSTGSSTSTQVKLPLVSTGTYNFTVDWGDGSTDTITVWNQSEVTHTYSSPGVYTVMIDGVCNAWRFANTGDRLKILEILNWGIFSFVGVSNQHFDGCANMDITAYDAPSIGGVNMASSFRNCTALKGRNWNNWDVSSVAEFGSLFTGCPIFNADISNWNTASLTGMRYTFADCSSFNRSLGGWNVSKVTDMTGALSKAGMSTENYNSTLIGWEAQNVKNNVALGATNRTHSGAGTIARTALVNDHSWTITGDSAV